MGSAPTVALLQRAIAHYRVPLFQKLVEDNTFGWTFYCGAHDQIVSTGLQSPELQTLPTQPIRNRHVAGPFTYQTGVRLAGARHHTLMLDLGWTILSTPRYLLEAKSRGIAVIGWSKGIPQDSSRPESLAKRLYQRFLLSLCDSLVVYGQISRDYFLQRGYPRDRIFIAQNTIDTQRIADELPESLAQRELIARQLPIAGRFVFGYLGGMLRRKRIECVVSAYDLVRQQGHAAVLVLVGGGPAEPAVHAAVAASPFRSDIFIIGQIPVGEEGGWFQLFDAYLSFAQGGLGILEAMAHGRAVVSTPEKFPETELLADEDTALLSPDFSVESFAERMISAVRCRSALPGIGERARQRVLAEATLDRMADAIVSAVRAARVHRGLPARLPGGAL